MTDNNTEHASLKNDQQDPDYLDPTAHLETDQFEQTSQTSIIETIRLWFEKRRLEEMPILPKDDRDSQSLVIVIAVMCYLASLTAATLIAIDKATDRWTIGLTSTVTLRVKPAADVTEQEAFDTQLSDILSLARGTQGIKSAHLIDAKETVKLIEPWLGSEAFTNELPVPQLIDIEIDPTNPPNLKKLESDFQEIMPSAKLEDHTKWNDRIIAFAGLLQTVTLLLLIIIMVTTVIIVTFATRSWMVAKHEIVEALHLIGAHDRFIAQEFQKKFLSMGLQASCWGLLSAIITIFIMAFASSRISVLSSASLLPPIELDLGALLPLLLVPLTASLLATLTARFTVMRIIENELY